MVEKIRLVHYNNKSRQGTYIGIKIGKQREKLYKFTPNTPIDLYMSQARSKKNWRELQKNVKEWHGNTNYQTKYVQKIRKSGRLSTQFKKGHTTYKTQLMSLGRKGELDRLYNRLLGALVLDKKLLPIVLANKQKLTRYFSHTIEVYGRKDGKEQKIVRYLDVGRRLPENVYNSYFRQHNYRRGTILNKEKVDRDIAMLKLNKANARLESQIGSGTAGTPITKVLVTTTYQIG